MGVKTEPILFPRALQKVCFLWFNARWSWLGLYFFLCRWLLVTALLFASNCQQATVMKTKTRQNR